MKKGFSIIEIIISIAIITILLTVVTTSYRAAQLKKAQESITQSILVSLEEQRVNTQAGKEGSNYGVKFNSDGYTLFTGTSYSEFSPNNTVFSIDPQFEISETISNGTNIIFFSKLNGNANETATITISHISDQIDSQSLIIETSGAISVIE